MSNEDAINTILSINDLDLCSLNKHSSNYKKVLKSLRKQFKELEYLRKTGGVTVVLKNNAIITTYHTNSFKSNFHKKTVVY